MKAIVIVIAALFLYSCNTANESREKMDAMATRTSDSLLNKIDSSLREPLKVLSINQQPLPTSTYVFEYK